MDHQADFQEKKFCEILLCCAFICTTTLFNSVSVKGGVELIVLFLCHSCRPGKLQSAWGPSEICSMLLYYCYVAAHHQPWDRLCLGKYC